MTIMIRMKSFHLFGVNLGPFSAHDCPDVHFRPAVVDWVVEGVALLLVVLGWVGVLWQYTAQGGQADSSLWVSAISSLFVFALMVTGARLPVRFIRFPVRVDARNVGQQYVCVVRLLRAFNVCVSLLFAVAPWTDHHLWARIAFLAALVLMGLSLAVYYVAALRLK